MKIRLISDLHRDINRDYPLDMKANGCEDMFTLVAGDISGSPLGAAKWIKSNISRGAFISGNHDVYDTEGTIEEVKAAFAKEFPASSDVTYFDYEVGVVSKDIGENILLVADVMYTDYTFPAGYRNPTGDVQRNMCIADPWRSGRGGMNDFNYGMCKKTWKSINDSTSSQPGRLVPEYYLEHHIAAFNEITKIVDSNKDKDIILMTHHCLSPKCIDEAYDHDSLNASYVSNKEAWIIAHPNIKCICSGHIHARKSFNVGNALYAMNALGYCREHYREWSNEARSYVPWTPDCIIDTSTWTVEFKPHELKDWDKQYEREYEKFNKILPFLI